MSLFILGLKATQDKFHIYKMSLTHFCPICSFHTSWKRQKTVDYRTFSGDTKRELRGEMGLNKLKVLET